MTLSSNWLGILVFIQRIGVQVSVESPINAGYSSWSTRRDCEGVAQLVRASDCRSEGCGIVPHLPRQNLLPSGFAGSNPAPATRLFRIVGLVYLILIQETWSSNLPRAAMTLSSEARAAALHAAGRDFEILSVNHLKDTFSNSKHGSNWFDSNLAHLSMLSCLDFLERWQKWNNCTELEPQRW